MIGAGIPNPMMISGGRDPLDEFGKINRSIRLRNSATPSIRRTPSVTGNRKTFVFAAWVKLSDLSVGRTLFSAAYNPGLSEQYLGFAPDNTLILYNGQTATALLNTSGAYRDPDAWAHVIFAIDTTQAAQENRGLIIVDGVAAPLQTSALPLNYDTVFSAMTPHGVGCLGAMAGYTIGGYLAHACYIDGYPSGINSGNWSASAIAGLFGVKHPVTGQWRPRPAAVLKSLADAGGTNSFFLPFDDATSIGTLAADDSSKGNNWTATNISLTPGATYDSMLDTPTNNFPVVNALVPLNYVGSGGYVTDGGLLSVSGYNNTYNCFPFSTISVPVGFKAYAEMTLVNNVYPSTTTVGCSGAAWVASGGSSPAGIGIGYGGGDLIGIGIDRVNHVAKFYKNGVFVADLAISATGEVVFVADGMGNNGYTIWRHNYGQHKQASGAYYPDAGGYFQYAPPSGFSALCSKNLKYDASATVPVSGTFSGNLNSDGPFVQMNGCPETLTINGNAVTFGVHADRLSNGFKLRTSGASYNNSGGNSWAATILAPSIKSLFRFQNAKGN